MKPKVVFYIRFLAKLSVPKVFRRRRLKKTLARELTPELKLRLDYYCQLEASYPLPVSTPRLKDVGFSKPSSYYLDFKPYLRYFDESLKVSYLYGDVTHVPEFPTLVKSRPINDKNHNSVLFKLNTIRHFTFVKDQVPFHKKEGKAVWRGNVWGIQTMRQDFLRTNFGKACCNVGHTNDWEDNRFKVDSMSLKEQLNYRYVLSIEGNDVATNLKWIMSSNSLCLMARPRYETWFMEGRLVAGVHYVELKDDFSDLEEKVIYYNKHIEEAEGIVKNANAYVEQFKDGEQEKCLSLLVLNKFFEKTNV